MLNHREIFTFQPVVLCQSHSWFNNLGPYEISVYRRIVVKFDGFALEEFAKNIDDLDEGQGEKILFVIRVEFAIEGS